MMSILFLITVIFFLLLLKFLLVSKEYTVDDHGKAALSTILILFFCILLAKGKIVGHLSVKDAAVTPVIQLNEYAVRGPYKILYDLKNFDILNIYLSKDLEKFKRHGMVEADLSEEEAKAREMLFRFNPRQEL